MLKNQLVDQKNVFPKKLPPRRSNVTHKATIGNVSIFFTVGEYKDGTPGELFIDTCKTGATLRSLCNCLAIAVSLGLQYGIPLETFVSFFTQMNFEPNGHVKNGEAEIKHASSIVDYIFRVLAKEYLNIEIKQQQKTELIPK